MAAARKEKELCGYFAGKFDMLQDRRKIQESQDKIQALEADQEKAAQDVAAMETEIQKLTAKSEELLRKISSSGYEELKSQLKAVNELVEHLGSSQARWKQTAEKLAAWNEEGIASNSTLWDIEAFEKGVISEEALKRLKEDLLQMRKEWRARYRMPQPDPGKEQRTEEGSGGDCPVKGWKQSLSERTGNRRNILQTQLFLKTGKSVEVEVLADLLEVRDDAWRNAIEGYLGNNKLLLTVEPKYAKAAMEIYKSWTRKNITGCCAGYRACSGR